MAQVEVRVPDIGDFKDVEVIEVLVKPGDRIAVEQSLVTVESDKASMEIPSSHAGVVEKLEVQLGSKVNQGSALLLLQTDEEAALTPLQTAAAPSTSGPLAATAPAPSPAAAPPAVVPAPAAPATGGIVDVLVPDIGDFAQVGVIEVFVKPGDRVKVEQSLVTVESDKASMEIPSSHAGVVQELKVKLGDKVSRGSVILSLATNGAGAAAALAPAAPAQPAQPAQSAEPAQPAAPPAGARAATPAAAPPAAAAPVPAASAASAPATVPEQRPGAAAAGLPHASPSIRRMARELGVPLEEVKGSGPRGRITEPDLQGFVKAVMAGDTKTAAQQAKVPAAAAAGGTLPGLLPWPQVDFAKFGPVERADLSRIRKISGANLHRNWVLIPHVTNHDDADITELEAFRVQLNKEHDKSGVKVTLLAFLIKACVAALRKFPEFNASLDGDQLVLKKYFHIGFAADTPTGLVVPVLRDADAKGILQISKEMGELAAKAREGKLAPAQMSGGCFSISSLGGIGGTYFTPIINAPEVAILGVCRSEWRPRWNGEKFKPRLMLPLSLSWDHRVIDGASAARFNVYLASVLADFRRVLL